MLFLYVSSFYTMNIKELLVLALSIFFFASCGNENLKPIITFEDAGKGAYPRLVTESQRVIYLSDIDNSAYTYTVEFVDVEQGDLVAAYDLVVKFEDNYLDNGDNTTGTFALNSWEAADFTTNSSGFKTLENITVTANDIIAAVGLNPNLLGPSDVFSISGFVTTLDGSVYGASNSSPSVKSPVFRGHFDFNIGVF